MLLNGYIDPGEYAWITDRNYSQKNGTYFFYFSLDDPPRNNNHYVPVKSLDTESINIINERRDEIGIPHIPYNFKFITPHIL